MKKEVELIREEALRLREQHLKHLKNLPKDTPLWKYQKYLALSGAYGHIVAYADSIIATEAVRTEERQAEVPSLCPPERNAVSPLRRSEEPFRSLDE